MNDVIKAAEHMDWIQVVLNGDAPCFYIQEDGRFCGRTAAWFGHGLENSHCFVSLSSLLLRWEAEASLAEAKLIWAFCEGQVDMGQLEFIQARIAELERQVEALKGEEVKDAS